MNNPPAPQAETPQDGWLTDELIEQRLRAIMEREIDDDNVDVSRFGSAI